MPRIAGVDIPKEKRLEIALTYIHGIGRRTSNEIILMLKMDPSLRAHKLSEADAAKLTSYIQGNYTVEGDLRREVQRNIQRLVSIGCYRGMRHKMGLPVRGQKTQTNARTRKGKKKTIANKKK